MRLTFVTLAAAALLASPALAQGTSSGSASGTSTSAPAGSTAAQGAQSASQLATAAQLKQELQKAGFTDVNVVAESFVVQAKTKDGDPVLMTIGPRGMTVFQAVNASDRPGSTTGSTAGSSAGSPASGTAPSGTAGSPKK